MKEVISNEQADKVIKEVTQNMCSGPAMVLLDYLNNTVKRNLVKMIVYAWENTKQEGVMKTYRIDKVDYLNIIKSLERLSDRMYLSENEEVVDLSFKVDKIIDDLNDSIEEVVK